ncbi:Rmf/CrpP family protein [Sphingomonas sp. TZW2008]|uniref:Rmf/CrpP family protein n=1 Tax=Sphingomonas sp. TZW2008 TaxID=1917973 RepID=UPI001181AEFB|nr:Rmf/CrpP family protein [Sphingomonas sp. TZW2008]
MMVDHFDLTTEEQARAAGKAAGAQAGMNAIDCPIFHDRLDLRSAWMDGFSEGRVSQSGNSVSTD